MQSLADFREELVEFGRVSGGNLQSLAEFMGGNFHSLADFGGYS